MSNTTAVQSREEVNRLIDVLGDLGGLHGRLMDLVSDKVNAMRRAEVEQIADLTHAEQELIDRIAEREQDRLRIVERLCPHIGYSPRAAKTMTISRMAERLSREEGDRLMAAADGLKDVLARLVRVNRVATGVARSVLGHLQAVLAPLVSGDESAMTYSPRGGLVGSSGQRMFEAVG